MRLECHARAKDRDVCFRVMCRADPLRDTHRRLDCSSPDRTRWCRAPSLVGESLYNDLRHVSEPRRRLIDRPWQHGGFAWRHVVPDLFRQALGHFSKDWQHHWRLCHPFWNLRFCLSSSFRHQSCPGSQIRADNQHKVRYLRIR